MKIENQTIHNENSKETTVTYPFSALGIYNKASRFLMDVIIRPERIRPEKILLLNPNITIGNLHYLSDKPQVPAIIDFNHMFAVDSFVVIEAIKSTIIRLVDKEAQEQLLKRRFIIVTGDKQFIWYQKEAIMYSAQMFNASLFPITAPKDQKGHFDFTDLEKRLHNVVSNKKNGVIFVIAPEGTRTNTKVYAEENFLLPKTYFGFNYSLINTLMSNGISSLANFTVGLIPKKFHIPKYGTLFFNEVNSALNIAIGQGRIVEFDSLKDVKSTINPKKTHKAVKTFASDIVHDFMKDINEMISKNNLNGGFNIEN